MNCIDWHEEARDLKFNQGLSWTELADKMGQYWPEMDKSQAIERLRGYLRTTNQYNKPKLNYKGNNKYNYTFDSIRLYPIGDIHIGAWGFNEKEFARYIDMITHDDIGKVILLGDICDNATLGSKGCVFSQKLTPQQQKEKAIELLYPIKDKILFLCSGNHCERSYKQTGNDLMYDIAMGLGQLDKYNPVCGYIKIKVGSQSYQIYATHNMGRSESKLKLMAKSFVGIDLFLTGHIHTPKVLIVPQKGYGGAQVDSKLIVVGSWLIDENYAVSAAYEPSSNQQFRINLREDIRKIDVTI